MNNFYWLLISLLSILSMCCCHRSSLSERLETLPYVLNENGLFVHSTKLDRDASISSSSAAAASFMFALSPHFIHLFDSNKLWGQRLSHKIIWNTKVRYDLVAKTMDRGDDFGTEPLELICIPSKSSAPPTS